MTFLGVIGLGLIFIGPVLIVLGLAVKGWTEDTRGCVFVLGCIMSFIMLFACSITVSDHVNNIADLREGYRHIEIQETRIASLSEHIETISDQEFKQALLANGDSPVASLMVALANAESSLADTRHRIAEASIEVTARSMGLMGIVPVILPAPEENES